MKSFSVASCLPLSPNFLKRDSNCNKILLPPLDIKAIEPISTSNYTYVNSAPKQQEKEQPLLRATGNNINLVQTIVVPPQVNMESQEFSASSTDNKQSKNIEIFSQIK
jgi:hypothetical protein